MSDIRKNLEKLADEIESLKKPQQPKAAPLPVIKDRSLSGNCITGGTIENFASTGIADNAKSQVLEIQKDGIRVSTAYVDRIGNDVTVQGDLDVKGEVTASKLHVKELTAENRNDALNPVEFKLNEDSRGNGLIWTGGSTTKQFKFRTNSDRLWSSESIDLHNGKEYKIGNATVLTESVLGPTVVKSSIRELGLLNNLEVAGNVSIDDFVFYDSGTESFAIGTDTGSEVFAIGHNDQKFIIDNDDREDWRIGSWSNTGLDFITDNSSRIHVSRKGTVTIKSHTTFSDSVSIGVNNPAQDVDLTISGSLRFQDKKFEVAKTYPQSGLYRLGDIVWNDAPKPSGYVGWICVREGSPGEWKPFGFISK